MPWGDAQSNGFSRFVPGGLIGRFIAGSVAGSQAQPTTPAPAEEGFWHSLGSGIVSGGGSGVSGSLGQFLGAIPRFVGGAIPRFATSLMGGGSGISISPVPFGPPIPGASPISVSPVPFGPPLPAGSSAAPNAPFGGSMAARNARGLGSIPGGVDTSVPGWALANRSEILKRNQT